MSTMTSEKLDALFATLKQHIKETPERANVIEGVTKEGAIVALQREANFIRFLINREFTFLVTELEKEKRDKEKSVASIQNELDREKRKEGEVVRGLLQLRAAVGALAKGMSMKEVAVEAGKAGAIELED